MSTYSIEARSLSVVGLAGHSFWVLRDESGKAIAELHGLATNRETGRAVPIGTNEDKFSLRVWHYPHDPEYAASVGTSATSTSYIKDGQDSRTVLIADKDEVLARWNAAVAAKDPLNAMDLDYPVLGVKLFGPTVNSNSTYRTLGEVMGVPVSGFSGVAEPGIRNRMATPEQIRGWRDHGYPVLDKPSVNVDGKYIEIGSRRGDASSVDGERPIRHAALVSPDAARLPGHEHYPLALAALGPALASSEMDPHATDSLCKGIGVHCSQNAHLGTPTHFLMSKDGDRVLVRYGEHQMSEIGVSDALALGLEARGTRGSEPQDAVMTPLGLAHEDSRARA